MRRGDVEYLIILGLFLSGLYVAVTGLVMDLFGLHRFLWHAYAGYTCAALAALHLALHWDRVTAYLRRRLERPRMRPRPDVRARELERLPSKRRQLILATLTGLGGFLLGRLTPRPPTWESADLGQRYHAWSKPGASSLLSAALDWGPRPEPYKRYPGVPRVALPDPRGFRGLSVEEAIEARRSRREYAPGALSLEQLSRLLHAANGITAPSRGFRSAPSAGALYPIETYVIVHQVAQLQPGIYHYLVPEHALEQIRVGDLRSAVTLAGIGQEMLGQAQVCLVLSAIFQRTRWKYRERAYRYILLEAGHIGQNVYLAATSMGLGACAVGAFLDDMLNELLSLDGEEEATLYIIAVGRV